MREKEDKLFESLRTIGRAIVAFSGGTDSAYLAWAAHHVLGSNVLAVTADSASLPASHKRDAARFVERFGIPHEFIQTREFDNPHTPKTTPTAVFTARMSCSRGLISSAASAGSRTSSTA